MAYKKEDSLRKENKEENPFTERNRRERPRMSDITRAVDKVVEEYVPGTTFGNQPGAYEEGGQAGSTTFAEKYPYVDKLLNGSAGHTQPPVADKNTPTSLKSLRWEIYDLLDRYDADYGRTIKFTLMQEVERLFNIYTHS